MDKHAKIGELMLIRTLTNMPEYIRLGKELAELLTAFRSKHITLEVNERWQIKGNSYIILSDVAQVNYKLQQQSVFCQTQPIWLSELLPLSHSDFQKLS